MKLYIHLSVMAVGDYAYWFKTSEYWILPMRVSGDLKLSHDEKTYIHRGQNYHHLVNAKLIKKVVKTLEDGIDEEANQSTTTTYGLFYFEIELKNRRLNFFMESGSYSENWAALERYEEGKCYTGSIKFFAACGCISSLVDGLWDDFEIPKFGQSWKRNPYSLLRIEELFWENGPEAYTMGDLFEYEYSLDNTVIVGCDYMGTDEFGGKILSNYALENDGKVEFKNIGTLKFALINLYLDMEPEYLAIINGSVVQLTHIIGDDSMEEVYEKLSNERYVEDDYRCQWTLEEVSIKFYDGKKMDIAGWDDSEPYNRPIIVQYTFPDFGEVLTTTNLEEIKAFAQWNTNAINRKKSLLKEAQELGYKFDWDIGRSS